MTADEAKQALEQGKNVRPKEWAKEEEKCYINNCIAETSGIFELYKDDEWELVE